MAYITEQAYYETEANNGSYQYMSLSDVIKNFMYVYVGPDKIIDNVEPQLVRWHAKTCIKYYEYDASKNNLVLEFIVGDDLKMIMPHDYVDFIRISKLVDGILYPMEENFEVMSATKYAQDANYALTFDGSGNVIYEASSDLDDSRLNNTDDTDDPYCCYQYSYGKYYGSDTSRMNTNPKFRVNRSSGVIDFDSSMVGDTIVIEYVGDGMKAGNDDDIKIHKFFEKYLYTYIASEILETKYGTEVVRRREWRKKKRAEYNNAKIRIGDFSPNRLLMTIRGKDRQLK